MVLQYIHICKKCKKNIAGRKKKLKHCGVLMELICIIAESEDNKKHEMIND